jgi:hypothetical protein
MESDLTPATIDKIAELSKKGEAKENRVIELDVGGGPKQFDAQSLKRIYDDPRPCTLEVSSLSAIADYVREKLEGVDGSKLFARIVSPVEVELLESFSGDQKMRTLYMRAKLVNDVTPFRFGSFLDTESFVISMMSLFRETDDLEKVLAVASSLVSEAKVAKTDDKATTKTQANLGVINTSGVEIPKVVNLEPYRTFRQVAQPISSFIFRYRSEGDEIGLALFEADGGAWKHEAMENIAKYFKDEVPELKIIA